MHGRTARPTIRVLAEELDSGWEDSAQRRAVVERRFEDLHPLSQLKHPVLRKSAEVFPDDQESDNPVGAIRSSTRIPLSEVKVDQWRAGVWRDPGTSVNWILVTGLAKGDHLDHDDFYQLIKRADKNGSSINWKPSEQDIYLLKRETSALLLLKWELAIQKGAHDALQQATIRVLISLNPPHDGWDRIENRYWTIAETGQIRGRVSQLSEFVAREELDVSEPTQRSHYSHREHLARSTVNGNAVRALCGLFFVPTQDHKKLEPCDKCCEVYDGLRI